MKHILLKMAIALYAALVVSANCDAQTKTDLSLIRQADQLQQKAVSPNMAKSGFSVQDTRVTSSNAKSATSPAAAAEKCVRVTAVLADGAEIPTAKLKALGIKVSYKAFRNVGLLVPVSAVPQLDSLDEFSSFSAAKKFRLDNKVARRAMCVDTVQNEMSAIRAGLNSTYSGEGVVVGVFDSGIDYNHANFRDPVTKQTRIKEAMVFRKYGWGEDGDMIDEKGERVEDFSEVTELYTSSAEIDTLTCDITNESHGTHTSGIAAGSYAGSYKNVDGKVVYTRYQGVASKANLILAGAKNLQEGFEYTALSEMDRYATEANEPLVVNLSLGTYMGWFDGKDETSQFYDEFTGKGDKPGRVLCVSSGNSADCNYTLYKALNSDNDHTLYTLVNCTESGNSTYPYSVATYMNIFSSSSEDTLTINTYGYSPKKKEISDLFYHNDLVAHGNLYRNMYENHDGRYAAQLYFPYNVDDSLQLLIEIKSKKDCKVRLINMTIDGEPHELVGGTIQYTGTNGETCTHDATAGDTKSSINSSNCTNSVISVGAWQDNLKWGFYSYEGKGGYCVNLSQYGYTAGEICDFSSYCLADDNGFARPDVAAPGSMLLSGYNSYDTSYFDSEGIPVEVHSLYGVEYVCGLAAEEYGRADGRHSALGAMQGTSQACPNVVGVIALWLQANPQLTQNQIKEVIANTCDTDDFTKAHPEQFGYGKINALKGLQYILKNIPTAIHEVVNGEPKGLDMPANRKVLENGRIVIVKDGKHFSVTGLQLD